MAEALLSGRGEASGAALARELVVALKALPPEDRLEFCRHIAAGFTLPVRSLETTRHAFPTQEFRHGLFGEPDSVVTYH